MSQPYLTRREHEVAHCLARGLTPSQIADELFITLGSVHKQAYLMRKRLGVKTNQALVSLLFDIRIKPGVRVLKASPCQICDRHQGARPGPALRRPPVPGVPPVRPLDQGRPRGARQAAAGGARACHGRRATMTMTMPMPMNTGLPTRRRLTPPLPRLLSAAPSAPDQDSDNTSRAAQEIDHGL